MSTSISGVPLRVASVTKIGIDAKPQALSATSSVARADAARVGPFAGEITTLEQRTAEQHQRDEKIDHEPRDVDDGRDEGRGRARGIEAEPAQQERKHRPDERPEGHDAKHGESHRQRQQEIVRPVIPDSDLLQHDHASDNERAADRAEYQYSWQLTHRTPPPVLQLQLTKRHRADHD